VFSEASKEVLIEQLDVVVDNLNLNVLELIVFVVALHEPLEFGIDELNSFIGDELFQPFLFYFNLRLAKIWYYL